MLPECYCRVRMRTKQQYTITLQLISYDDKSPIFVSEVDVSLHDTFNALEFMPMVEILNLNEEKLTICMHWFTPGARDAIDAVNSLIEAGASSLSALTFENGAFCMGYVHDKEGIKRLTTWNGNKLSSLCSDADIPTMLKEIGDTLIHI